MVATYRILANKIGDKAEALLSELAPSEGATVGHTAKRKADHRGQRVAGTQAVPKCVNNMHGQRGGRGNSGPEHAAGMAEAVHTAEFNLWSGA